MSGDDFGIWANNWIVMMDNGTKLLTPVTSDTTNIRVRPSPHIGSHFTNNYTEVTTPTINIDIACRIRVGSTDYLLGCANGSATFKRYNSDGTTETAITFSGTAPTAARRIGFDPLTGYILIADGTTKAATNIKRYTISGTTLTNINSDLTLNVAPNNDGTSHMFVGQNYIIINDVSSPSAPRYRKYDKTTGASVDTTTMSYFSGSYNAGMIISTNNKMYLPIYRASAPTGLSFFLFEIDI
jgi:hypothetical protein